MLLAKKAISVDAVQRIIKKQLDKKILTISSIVVLFLGLGYLTGPIIDGWSEIFIPGGSNWPAIYLLVDLLLAVTILVAAVVYVISFTVVLIFRRSIGYVICALPIVILICTWHLLYPPGITQTDIRINSFQLGAQTRIIWAGGASKIRQEALTLLKNTSTTTPASLEWPASIRALGAIRVEIEKGKQIVRAIIPQRRYFFVEGDEFGYFITGEDVKESVLVDKLGGPGHRLWKIAEGIYLYEKW